MRRTLLLGLALLGVPALGKPVEDLDPILREIDIAADVFRASLRKRVPQQVRISNVQAAYLANQGVLISLDAATPWIRVDELTERSIDIGRDVNSFDQIPAMVHDILAELKIAIAPYEPEALEELRELREEQRALRGEQRRMRGSLREERRKLLRAEDDELDGVTRKINELERELAAADAEYDALHGDIDAQYERLREVRQRDRDQPETIAKLDAAVGTTACNYGATLKSLDGSQHLTVAVNLSESARYYVFEMRQVNACQDGDIDSVELLGRSYVYDL